MMESTTWRDRLKHAIDEYRLAGGSMSKLSRMAGRDDSYVSKMLRDNQTPTVEAMAGIAEGLNVSLAWLMTGIDLAPEQEEIMRIYTQLEPKNRTLLLDLARSLSGGSSKT
jgi:transcriptional regulator with XRE-family HTH domain